MARSFRGRVEHRLWQEFTQMHCRAYRLSSGRIGKTFRGSPVLLVDHVGRKTGKKRTSPLIFGRDGDDLVIVASYGGAKRDPVWWPNLKANPHTKVNVYGEERRVVARQASPEEKQRLWPMMVDVYAPYEEYQQRTERDIPVVILSREETSS